jgi:predicted transcriptional regulator
MRPVDMTPEEREAVEEAEEVWTWIASLAIAAGIMFLIRSLVTFISRRSFQRS